MIAWKKIVKSIIPPCMTEGFRKLKSKPEYLGNYKSFGEAQKYSTGYDDPQIFEQIKEARLKVLRGEVFYERDGVTFDAPQYFWPLLTCLLSIASNNEGNLKILDFGGSLGTTYFQNMLFIKNIPKLRWIVVEQKQFVEYGKQNLQEERLRFYDTVEEALEKEKPDVALFSSSLQYLEKPYNVLDTLQKAGLKFFIFDRTTFIQGEENRIVIQRPERTFKKSTFPAWLFGKKSFNAYFENDYKLITEFPSIGNPITTDRGPGECLGMLFAKKNINF